jgi:probable F420-dependent oxidoreductase
MQIAVSMIPTDYSATPVEVARAVEERGLSALLVAEHTHIPTSRETPYPGGGELPRQYSHSLDPFVALSMAAAVTSKIRLGTAVCLVVERDPIVLAKEVATLDRLSGGRFIFGIGAGWNREEMANHGTDPATRWRLLRERMEAMRAIWSSEEAEYHGELVDFGPLWSWPKPVQQPGPPVVFGGAGRRALEAVVEYADEWAPIYGRPDDLGARIADLQRAAAERGRAPIPVSVVQAPPEPDRLAELGDLGVEKVVLTLPSAGMDEILPALDRYADLAERLA